MYKCINPICYYIHPDNYNIALTYIEHIINEKKKCSKFKSVNYIYNDKCFLTFKS